MSSNGKKKKEEKEEEGEELLIEEFKFIEPTDEELFKELTMLTGDASIDPSIASHYSSGLLISDFGMIRIGDNEDIGDHNVQNIQLCPEDEQDPELLAELSQLSTFEPEANEKPLSVEETSFENDESTNKEVQKHDASLLNMTTDKEEVGEKEEENAKENENDASHNETFQSPVSEPSDELNELKRQALEAKRRGDMQSARQLMSQLIELGSSNKDSSSPNATLNQSKQSQRQRKIIANRLVEQVQCCGKAAKALLAAGNKAEAEDFLRKEKKFLSDLRRLEGLNKTKPTAGSSKEEEEIKTKAIVVEIPIYHVNHEVEDGTILLLFNQINVSTKCKLSIKAESHSFAIRTFMEWPPQGTDQEHTRQSKDLFKIPTDKPIPIIIDGIKRDLRCAKFFEHHKLFIELLQKESSFFRTKYVLIGKAGVRMSLLLTVGKMKEKVELLDEGKSTGISIEFEAAVHQPISPRASICQKQTVEWIQLEEEQKQQPKATPPIITKNNNIVDDIASYVVLEEEIKSLKDTTDPEKLEILLALENKLEQLTMAVDLGQLTMEEYLGKVNAAIPIAKQKALSFKRAGNLVEARRWLGHANLMEQEIREVQAGE